MKLSICLKTESNLSNVVESRIFYCVFPGTTQYHMYNKELLKEVLLYFGRVQHLILKHRGAPSWRLFSDLGDQRR